MNWANFALIVSVAIITVLLSCLVLENRKFCNMLEEASEMEADYLNLLRRYEQLLENYKEVDVERDRLADMVCGDVPKSMSYLSREIHRQAVAHGWWDDERSFPEIVALCHSELSEALEEYRDAKPMEYVVIEKVDEQDEIETDPMAFGERKPEGVAVEMVDCIIRILDWCCKAGVDVDDVIERKMAYNVTRPYKHSGKVC